MVTRRAGHSAGGPRADAPSRSKVVFSLPSRALVRKRRIRPAALGQACWQAAMPLSARMVRA
jgi:hypothetical protein